MFFPGLGERVAHFVFLGFIADLVELRDISGRIQQCSPSCVPVTWLAAEGQEVKGL
jgi:hypothetical protein